MLSGLAAIILLIACVNYMNLTTARASLRAKEVGMRKVVGANQTQLLKQFMGESLLLALAASLVALLMVELLLPIFSNLVEREMSFGLLRQGKLVAGVLLAILVVGFIAGSYPAFFLTAFQPVKVLKGKLEDNGRSHLRSILVVLQFTATAALIICTVVVQKQLQSIKGTKFGFNREQVLVMRMRDAEARKRIDLIKRDLMDHP